MVTIAAGFEQLIDADATGAYEDVRAVVLQIGDRPVLERYYDSSPEETSNVFSVTKSVMSILVGIALDEGRLRSVEQTLAELLPGHAGSMSPQVAGITLEQVLTMTAGLPSDSAEDATLFTATANWVDVTLSLRLVTPPGKTFGYSSAGSHLLSAILVEATDTSVLDYARKKLFDPLSIDTSAAAEPLSVAESLPAYEAASFAWPVDPQGLHTGGGGLKISAPDMVKLGRLMLHGGRWGDRQIVPKEWAETSTEAHVAADETGAATGRYGYQWWVSTAGGHEAFSAVGFGGQLIEVVPALELLLVVSSTVPENPRLQSGPFLALMDQLIAPALTPKPPG